MRFSKITIIAAILLLPASAYSQHSATAFGKGARAQVRATVSFAIPEFFRVVETAPAQATWQGDRFTEFLIKYTVAANTQWEFAADALPHGVTLLARGGEWHGVESSDLVVQRGAVSNGTEVLVRVRVADGASIYWRDELKLRARSAQSVAVRYAAED
jgi:hypothetical protein